MQKIRFKIPVVFVLLVITTTFYGQEETLTGISGNPLLKASKKGSPIAFQKTKAQQDTLSLPFVEDFAKSIGYPDATLWQDNMAFINYQYSSNSISIGVATLDAINAHGDVYKHANTTGFPADTLTSAPIHLSYSPSDSAYLSFYYQAGGLGDQPEITDSLVLQFYQADSAQWESIWHTTLYNDSIFIEKDIRKQLTDTIIPDTLPKQLYRHINLPVKEEYYLKSGFRFRFINYASISDFNLKPSIASNVDHWNLDFIRLDTNRTHRDTTINDIAFIEPMKPLLNNYESIPWHHFHDDEGESEAITTEMDDSIYITYRNIGDKVWNVSREFEIIDQTGYHEPYTFTGGTGDNIPPYTAETYPRKIDYIFPDNQQDSALFKLTSYLVTDTTAERAPYRWNDTIHYDQKFYNYYAYDDGTAENGYGISGEGSEYAMVALRFKNYKSDTLQAIQMYFNQTIDSVGQSFKLLVWEDNNGIPGEVIYSESGFKQMYGDEINRFHNYAFRDKPYLEPGKYFIGYQKFTTGMLNIGFDVNRIHNDRVYYFVDGSWNPSKYKGTIMMRPVMGKYIQPNSTTAINEQKMPSTKLKLYPNPARDNIHFEIMPADPISHLSVKVYSVQGRIVQQYDNPDKTLNVSNLPAGMYILEVKNQDQGTIHRQKFLISR